MQVLYIDYAAQIGAEEANGAPSDPMPTTREKDLIRGIAYKVQEDLGARDGIDGRQSITIGWANMLMPLHQ
jgi:hypothetical protein